MISLVMANEKEIMTKLVIISFSFAITKEIIVIFFSFSY